MKTSVIEVRDVRSALSVVAVERRHRRKLLQLASEAAAAAAALPAADAAALRRGAARRRVETRPGSAMSSDGHLPSLHLSDLLAARACSGLVYVPICNFLKPRLEQSNA